jgi:hypothetical protein
VQSDNVIIALAVLSTVTTIITAILAAIVAIATRQTAARVNETHDLVNGMSHELTSARSGQDRAEAFTEGEAAQRERTAQKPAP